MTRFRILTVLLVIAFVAAWAATIQLDNSLATELRRPLWLVIAAIATASVIYQRGSKQAFWLGVSLVLVLRGVPNNWPFYIYRAKYIWINIAVSDYLEGVFPLHSNFVEGTVALLYTLAVCLLCGSVFAAVHKSVHRSQD